MGAVPLKNSVYVLPETDEHREDFQWLAGEIIADGGEATICSATMLSGVSDEDLMSQFPGIEPLNALATSRPPRGTTWVTRRGVFVDRIASAWLIRRSIDAEAKFKFVAATGYRPLAGEVRFDMYRGEYGHEGDACTFETLLRRFELRDPRLTAIGEMVHDIDCKDGKFGRAEAPGLAAILRGITAQTDDDAERLELGARVFEQLYGAEKR